MLLSSAFFSWRRRAASTDVLLAVSARVRHAFFFFHLPSAAWPQSPPRVTSSPVSFEGQQHHLFERKHKANTVPRLCWSRRGHRSPALRCTSICKGEAGGTSIAHALPKPKTIPSPFPTSRESKCLRMWLLALWLCAITASWAPSPSPPQFSR